LSSGYLPIAACVISEPVYRAVATEGDRLGTFSHGFTYGGHPVACAVALETLAIYEERNILAHVAEMAPLLQAGVRRYADHPLVGEVRGVGLLAGIELTGDKKTKAPAPKGAALLVADKCQAHGLIVRALGDSIAFCPPLVITAAEIGELLARFERGFGEAAAELGRRGGMSS
jgi:4-aminobutyrate--pyruvate transaminase